MTKSHNVWKKLLAFAISIILTFVTLPPFIAYADSNDPTPYAAATCGQCDKGTISLVLHMKKDIRQYLVIMD